jgi:N-acetylmuramoyl-L-alanine amidase
MSTRRTIILDPGHGMSNRRAGVFDPGTVHANHREADIAMEWANEIRTILLGWNFRVIRTRVDNLDPAPIGQRVPIAHRYGGNLLLSIHCNSGGGTGTETFYRGAANLPFARAVNEATWRNLHLRNRGPKLESQSQHKSLAVLSFPKAALLELGFLDHPGDRAKILDPALRRAAAIDIAHAIRAHA